MLALRSLQLGCYQLRDKDVRQLQQLRHLEHLQIMFSMKAKHCRSLRGLMGLRSLEVAHGWLRDIVGFLPRLYTLVWELYQFPRNAEWGRFGRRQKDRIMWGDACDHVAPLRRLVLIGEFTIDEDDPVVWAMIHHITHLEVCRGFIQDSLLKSLSRLRCIKRIYFEYCGVEPPAVLESSL